MSKDVPWLTAPTIFKCYVYLFLQLGLDISPEEMADLGIGGIGGADDDDDDDDDDESLEAELAVLQGESRSKVKKKSKYSCNATWDFLIRH